MRYHIFHIDLCTNAVCQLVIVLTTELMDGDQKAGNNVVTASPT